MRFRGLAVIALIFVSLSAFSHSTNTSCTVESPVDGSLWIGTSSEGIFRLGRNGRSVHYSQESGHLGSNSIISLEFDINKVLWILDTTGHITRYSSVKGFEKVLSFPDNITCAALSSDGAILNFCTRDLRFYRYSVREDFLSDPQILPFSVYTIIPSVEDLSLWLVSSDCTLRLDENDHLSTWSEGGSVSNMIPFVFETNVQHSTSRGSSKLVPYLIFALVILFIVLVLVLYRFLLNAHHKQSDTQPEVFAVVEEICVKSAPVATSSNALDTDKVSHARARVPLNNNEEPVEPGIFTKRVQSLIQEHIADPDFDVESIAAITGVSRIHVNRKLKAESSPSPSVMLKEARMKKASSLLRENKYTVAQICTLCGFSRPSYFTTAFKEYFGVTPTEFIDYSK